MTEIKRGLSLWPEHESVHPCTLDRLFEEDARDYGGIRDRHCCTLWHGPIVLCLRLPQIGSTSLELLRRADRDAYVDVIRHVVQETKQRVAKPKPRERAQSPDDVRLRQNLLAVYRRCGFEVREVSAV